MNQLIEEEVDIYEFPDVDPINNVNANLKDSELTIGDLHANTMKLIYMLIKHGIASGIDAKDYKKLVEIYLTPNEDLTEEILNEFNNILDKMQFNNSVGLIRLIGDELADRGSNDYFTLKVFEKLEQHGVKLEILVSNHGYEFIRYGETKSDFHLIDPRSQFVSLTKLLFLIDNNRFVSVSRDKIIEIAKKAYLPNLKAISYSIDEDTSEMIIYTHAAIDLKRIQELAISMGILGRKDKTIKDLANTIDKINSKFQEYITNKTVSTLCSPHKDSPLEFLMWNRDYAGLIRPTEYNGYNLKFVHGHDSGYDDLQDNFYNCNLDNTLGKTLKHNKGTYTVLYSKPSQLDPSQKSFLVQLREIKTKEEKLRKNHHPKAADAALLLYKTVYKEAYMFFNNHENNDEKKFEEFKNKCSKAIETAHKELDKHRGWKQILGNLALAVIGLGVLYAGAVVVNKAVTGNYLFFNKTDSANKVDKLEAALRAVTKATQATKPHE